MCSRAIIFDELNVVCSVAIGDLDPITETTGYRRRLEHLGYRRVVEASDSEEHAKVLDQLAIEAFQVAQRLTASGVLDDATRAVLLAMHGS